ncbi:MAG: UDP-2,3-diacylglucosamine diphosphatase [Candidatus Adiutrix sp.]|jgi:UDP-2,3-diacylglucosamine pyrophosphatase LpxH|nr:UDP-2,3-diacylglucosamine diphosphatase [Candidatus Adiutrix sp.]
MLHFRSIFISDLHLGSPWCRADSLLDFLSSVEGERLYLVGDILDDWHLSREAFLPEKQLQVWEALLGLAKKIEITYVTGNHDAFLRPGHPYRQLFRKSFADMVLCPKAVHRSADGRRYLVTHGDAFDRSLKIPLLCPVVTALYEAARSWLNRRPGLAKILDYERADALIMHWQALVSRLLSGDSQKKMLDEAKNEKLNGVICGHSHLAGIRFIDGLLYANCGHWSGPAHALVENDDGRIDLLPWGARASLESGAAGLNKRPGPAAGGALVVSGPALKR